MTPKEFVDNFNFKEQDDRMWLYSEEEVYTLLEEYGKQQYNQAIEDAKNSYDVRKDEFDHPFIYISHLLELRK